MVNNYNNSFSKEFLKPSISNEKLNWPELKTILGEIENKNILDLGCGSGYWLEKLHKLGGNCYGYDISEKQLEIGKKNLDKEIKLLKKDITKEIVFNKKFDIVILIKVLLEFNKKGKILQIIKNANNALKKGGKLIILDLHPFAPNVLSTIKTNKNYNYFNSGEEITAKSTKFDGNVVYYKDHHWMLSDITSCLYKSDFLINQIIEHRPSKKLVEKYPSLLNRFEQPCDIIFEAVKK